MARGACPSPVCSPARASFFTGRIPSRYGIHDCLQEPDESGAHPGIEGQKTAFFEDSERLDPQRAGTNMATILRNNSRDPWSTLPGQDDHRQ